MTVIYIYWVNCMKFGQLILRSHSNCCHEMSHFKAENVPNSILTGAPPQTPLRELTLPRLCSWIQGVLLLNGGRGNKGKRQTEEKKGEKKERENVRGRGRKGKEEKGKKEKGKFIGGFRGGKGAMPPKMPKVALLPCICSALLCAVKLIKFIPTICIFGSFYAPKNVCFRGCAPDRPLYRMQVNLHGSPCIPGVFLYCFGH